MTELSPIYDPLARNGPSNGQLQQRLDTLGKLVAELRLQREEDRRLIDALTKGQDELSESVADLMAGTMPQSDVLLRIADTLDKIHRSLGDVMVATGDGWAIETVAHRS